ncbi:zinc finger CCCH domain-containing protein 27 [Dorcoceras hygrometricum]|uniref:Zinc finger CCCH domain-containing protein 27 n=1 Tax=Dorcoceras hygrometricum TaxID=472368 RepID=A0A2Z7C577_9LAMI|nr:zinc finger CCCH domain-containing protein 27 [Dorcoceras hygrometricum]
MNSAPPTLLQTAAYIDGNRRICVRMNSKGLGNINTTVKFNQLRYEHYTRFDSSTLHLFATTKRHRVGVPLSTTSSLTKQYTLLKQITFASDPAHLSAHIKADTSSSTSQNTVFPNLTSLSYVFAGSDQTSLTGVHDSVAQSDLKLYVIVLGHQMVHL